MVDEDVVTDAVRSWELYSELDQMTDEVSGAFDPRPWHEDNPQRPKVCQPGPTTPNVWGIPTPPLFRE
jgi:hypothetical protein